LADDHAPAVPPLRAPARGGRHVRHRRLADRGRAHGSPEARSPARRAAPLLEPRLRTPRPCRLEAQRHAVCRGRRRENHQAARPRTDELAPTRGHGGAMAGHLAGVVVNRKTKIGAAVLTNSGTRGNTEVFALELAEKATELWPPSIAAWKPEEEPPVDVRALLGRWWSEGNEFIF